MPWVQGRVYADSPDEAAVLVRDIYHEYRGRLVILGACCELRWYEYGLWLDWGG